MAELEKLLSTDSKVESLKKINAIIENGGGGLDGRITNCILEIPQRIKLELNNGTLTLKAGSVVTVPYGTEDLTAQYPVGSVFINDNFRVYDTQFEDGKFFVWAEVQNDINLTGAGTVTNLSYIYVNVSNNNLSFNAITATGSGSDYTVDTTHLSYYDTTLNKVYKRSSTSSAWGSDTLAFPLCIFKREAGVIKSIDQVFNGFGCIGSTVWVDKGVKGLIPNGRNEDGSLNNIEYTLDNILVYTNQQFSTYSGDFSVKEDGDIVYIWTGEIFDVVNMPDNNAPQGYYYVSANNKMYWHPTGQDYQEMNSFKVGTLYSNSSIWEDADIKQPFRAVDYNDKSIISGWGMPSNRYIDLTFGASGATYTAPANGWFYLFGRCAYDQSISNITTGQIYCTGVYGSSQSEQPHTYNIPVKKGDNIRTNTAFPNFHDVTFRFIYAEGEK